MRSRVGGVWRGKNRLSGDDCSALPLLCVPGLQRGNPQRLPHHGQWLQAGPPGKEGADHPNVWGGDETLAAIVQAFPTMGGGGGQGALSPFFGNVKRHGGGRGDLKIGDC